MANNKNKKNKKKYTGPELIKSPDVYTGEQYSNMMDEITLTDKGPKYGGYETFKFQSDDPDAPNYVDTTPMGGIAPMPSGSLKGLVSMVKNIPQLIKNVPKYAKQLKSLRGVVNPAKFAADGSRIDPSKLTKAVKSITKTGKSKVKPNITQAADDATKVETLKNFARNTGERFKAGVQNAELPKAITKPIANLRTKVTPNVKDLPQTIKGKGDAAQSIPNWRTKEVKEAIKSGKIRKLKDGTYEGVTPEWVNKVEEYGPSVLKALIGGGVITGAAQAFFNSGDEKKKEYGGMYSKAKQYMQGGMQQLPGGVMQPIGGGAVEFVGNEHDESGMGSESGILLDEQTEVENGETMTQVAAQGGMKDYFFSNKLKAGGMTFADKHKEMLNNGAGQEQVNYLAKMQEAVAGRNPGDIKAAYGGMRKYEDAGFKDFSSEEDDPNYNPEEANMPAVDLVEKMPRLKMYTDTYETVDKAAQESGFSMGDRAKDRGKEGIARMQAEGEEGVFGDGNFNSEEAREDFYKRNKTILNEMGVNSPQEFNPKEMTGEFQANFNKKLNARWDNDESFRTSMEGKGVTKDQYLSTGFSGEKGIGALDGDYGEYSFSRTSEFGDPATPGKEKFVKSDLDFSEEYEQSLKEDEGDDVKEETKKDNTATYLAALSGIPAAMAFADTPDTMKNPDIVNPGIVMAERQGRENLDRVDYTNLLSSNTQDNQALMQGIDNQGGGSTGLVNKMAALANKRKADLAIKGKESEVNTTIGNQETQMNAQIESGNVSRALNASTANAGNILNASNANAANKMRVDDFNAAAKAATKDRKLGAAQYTVEALQQLHRDKLAYKASSGVTAALSGETGIDKRKDMEALYKQYGVDYNKS